MLRLPAPRMPIENNNSELGSFCQPALRSCRLFRASKRRKRAFKLILDSVSVFENCAEATNRQSDNIDFVEAKSRAEMGLVLKLLRSTSAPATYVAAMGMGDTSRSFEGGPVCEKEIAHINSGAMSRAAGNGPGRDVRRLFARSWRSNSPIMLK
jgi:hypothetical protein